MQGGGNIGRYAANQLGLVNVPGVATQRWCASGMAGTQWIAANIAAGMIDAGIGGGVESMSTAPGTSKPGPDGQPGFWLSPANLETEDAPPFNTAKGVGDNAARMAGITREQADAWAYRSHMNAIRAIDEGRFKNEIVPVPLADGSEFSVDEHPRRTSTLEKLATLPLLNPMDEGATTTAGNASGLNDAAAGLVLVSREVAEAHGLTPLGVIRAWASTSHTPAETGLSPTTAIPKALAKAGLSLGDISSCRDQRGLRLGARGRGQDPGTGPRAGERERVRLLAGPPHRLHRCPHDRHHGERAGAHRLPLRRRGHVRGGRHGLRHGHRAGLIERVRAARLLTGRIRDGHWHSDRPPV